MNKEIKNFEGLKKAFEDECVFDSVETLKKESADEIAKLFDREYIDGIPRLITVYNIRYDERSDKKYSLWNNLCRIAQSHNPASIYEIAKKLKDIENEEEERIVEECNNESTR